YLNRAVLEQIAGAPLTNGAHVLHLKVTDAAGNSATFNVSFTLANTAPAIPTLQIQNAPPQVAVGAASASFTTTFQVVGAEPAIIADGTNLTGTGATASVATTVPGTATTPAVQLITL